MVTLRPATAADEPFLLRAYASTRAQEMALVPWSEEEKQAFVEQQFRAQHAHYHREYAGADYLVVEVDGLAAGRLYVDRTGGEIHLLDIALLPEHRGTGLGTALIGDLVREADANGAKMRLFVEPVNPAKRLYERFGFTPIGALVGPYLEMIRPPRKEVS